jgi:hypothetical protein
MGMDVRGRNPNIEVGKYFRANIWSWRPIHELVIELCCDLLDEETLQGMSYNQGNGPTDGAICVEMANRFEAWMEHHAEGYCVESEDLRMLPGGRLVMGSDAEGQETTSPYMVSDEHLKQWIEFLRHCGGFEVW